MKPNGLGRRAFVKATGTAVGGMVLVPGCTSSTGRWRFFSDQEAIVVEAIAEQIIPADRDAGAREANVVSYIDRQLSRVFREHQEAYRTGIAGTQQTSNTMFEGDFESLEWSQQTEVLRSLESGEAEGSIWESMSSRSFFELIRDHTMQGFYGSPRHGGNHRFASFKMIGIDYPRIVGQNRYRTFPGKS
ncbi:MAG: gluconate 2-dehydrogenase subunit 3 family protein [Gemmatimonadota bacterium]|nr:MAG: gluconate 2-dehydrogenase subunit 3 family protein [Gemmatimonadota bacterium]